MAAHSGASERERWEDRRRSGWTVTFIRRRAGYLDPDVAADELTELCGGPRRALRHAQAIVEALHDRTRS